jgi:UDP-N-acetyl-D-glucosamine dehydrogenase
MNGPYGIRRGGHFGGLVRAALAQVSSVRIGSKEARLVPRRRAAPPGLAQGDSHAARLTDLFTAGRWTIGIAGLGYVGLPLATAAVGAGLRCIGFDVSAAVVDGLRAGRSHIGDVSGEDLAKASSTGLEITDSPTRLKDADALVLCVPSPLGHNRHPDMSFINAAAKMVAEVVTPGTLVVLESTTYPGTTDEILVPAATSTGLVLDHEVFVAFSPERVDPGNTRGVTGIPKVVGGVSPISAAVAAAAYRRLVPSVHMVSSARVAEMTKLLENTYRAVNIGLINEVAQLSHELGIDVWEVVEAAATKPFGFQAFYPGPGVGGHCIPLDPMFLAWRAREAKCATRFINLAEEVNASMPGYTVARITDLLKSAGKAVNGTRFLVLGVAYKSNVADDRESPAWDVLAGLAGLGADLVIHDQLVGAEHIRAHGYRAAETLGHPGDYDIAVVLTDHDTVDLVAVARDVPLIFDARGAFRRRGIHADHVTAI